MVELLFFIEACIVSFLVTGVILRYSLGRELLDIPNDRSSHRVPKPRLGGVAIVLAFYAACATLLVARFMPFPGGSAAVGTLTGGGIIAAVGLVDDLRGLGAWVKLFAQVSAAAIVIASGVVLEDLHVPLMGTVGLGALGAPLTLLWIVGCTNLYNFIDGIDGLAAGVGMIAAVFSVLVGVMAQATATAPLYAILAGSSLGFLRYNFPPARIFMGDTGSTFIGFMFATLAVIGAGAGVPVFVTVLLLGGVLGDAVLTMARRMIRRERLLAPHRTHYYQRLTSLGLSHKQVTLLEYLIAALLGTSALFYFHGDRVFVSVFSLVWIGLFLWAIMKIRSMERGGRLFWEGRTFAIAFGDIFFMAASYALSYYLRLNFRFPEAETSSLLISLPIVLVIRTTAFYYFGLYRGVWRYTSLDDLMRIVKAVSLSSLVMIVSFTLLFRFEAFPRSVFIIDWFILTVFIAGSRIATRWFHELPSHEDIGGRRVVIGGTGHIAEALLHRIKKSGGAEPVGIVDDRVEMVGRVVHGLEVLGSFSELPRLVRLHDVSEVVLLRPFLDRFPPERWIELQKAGASVRVVTDPSLPDAERMSMVRCGGTRIMIAGNGPLVESAVQVCGGADELVVTSNEAALLTAIGRRVPRDGVPVTLYLGVLHRRDEVERILGRHRPRVAVVDSAFAGPGFGNPLEGYARTALFPLWTLAAAVRRTRNIRLVAVQRDAASADDQLRRLVRVSTAVLRWMFRNDPERLLVLECGERAGTAGVVDAVNTLLSGTGGVFRLAEREDGSGVPVEGGGAPAGPDDVADVLGRLAASAGAAEEPDALEMLREMHETVSAREDDR
jgi:UDP-GlcNAc:undecaprenyl-phosphate GlcNAc-1-phosphate transferase